VQHIKRALTRIATAQNRNDLGNLVTVPDPVADGIASARGVRPDLRISLEQHAGGHEHERIKVNAFAVVRNPRNQGVNVGRLKLHLAPTSEMAGRYGLGTKYSIGSPYGQTTAAWRRQP